MNYEDITSQANVAQAAKDYIQETYGDDVYIPTGTLLQHLGNGSDEVGFQSSMLWGFGIKPLAVNVSPVEFIGDVQPLPINSQQYDSIALADDHAKAVFDYVVRVYGLDVANAFLVVSHEIWRLILAGYTESMTIETIQAMFGIKPL